MMNKRILFIFLIFSLLITSCDLISEQVVGKIQNVLETNPPQLVITKEMIVKTVEQVIVTTTPIPTPTPTPIPSFLGTPVQPDPAVQRAVAVSLLALGTDFEIRLFTRAPNGELMVWVRDNNYPDTLLCGAPLYFPGLGSLLVLTTTHFYTTINEFNTFSSASGCIAVSLSKGKAQVQKILEYYQGIYGALRANKRFSSSDGVYYEVVDFTSKHKTTPYPYELNIIFMPLLGEDLGHTSIELGCPMMAANCIRDYDFTGSDITYNNSTSRHVPLAYARFWDRSLNELKFLSENGKKLQTNSQPNSLLNKEPFSTEEILTTWFYQKYWEQLVYNTAFTAGLGTVFPNMDPTVKYNNPSFAPFLPFTGISHTSDIIIAQYLPVLGSYFDGKAKEVPTAAFEIYIQYARAAIKNTYFDFIVIEKK